MQSQHQAREGQRLLLPNLFNMIHILSKHYDF